MNFTIFREKPVKKVRFNEIAIEYRGTYMHTCAYFVNLRDVDNEKHTQMSRTEVPMECDEPPEPRITYQPKFTYPCLHIRGN